MLGGDAFLADDVEEEEGRGSVYSIPIEKNATAKKWYMRRGGEGRSLHYTSASHIIVREEAYSRR